MDAVDFFLDPVFVDTERSQFVQVHGKEGVSKARKTLHDLLKVHFEQFGFKVSQEPETSLKPPLPAFDKKSIPENPGHIAAHLTPEGNGP
jgi:hypothetical protein